MDVAVTLETLLALAFVLALAWAVAVIAAPAPTLPEFLAILPDFTGASWDGWRAILARLTPAVREFYAAVGRGAGKSRIVAAIACYFAARDYRRVSGEFIYIGIFAPDRKQAGVTYRYVLGLLRSVPALAALIEAETKESVTLTNGIVIEVISASIAAPRGRAYALVIVEEAAFLPTDESANPDVELLRAVRPALARVPGSLLCVVSSPYARRGVLWTAWQKYHGKPDGAVVFVQAATLDLNPTFDRSAVEKAYQEDPASAAAEYGGEFRGDVETFVSVEALQVCVVPGRRELPPALGTTYHAFVDPSGGSSDSFTLAIAHEELRGGQPVAVIDCVRETRPPFSPESVVADYAATLTRYGIVAVRGDRYGGEWPREVFQKHGLSYWPADKPKSDLYRDTLPLVNSQRIELLDHPRLLAQLGALERRTARGGRDSIDHPPGGHDDLANVCAGAALKVGGTAGFPVSAEYRSALTAYDPYDSDPEPPQPRTFREIEADIQRRLERRDRAMRGEPVVRDESRALTEFDPYADRTTDAWRWDR